MTSFFRNCLTALVCLAAQGLSCFWGGAQDKSSGWGFKVDANRMTIGSFRDSYKSTEFNTYTLEIDYITGPSGGKGDFASAYNYPVFGLGIAYNKLSDVIFRSGTGRYADMAAVYGKITRDLLRTKSLAFGYDISLGLSYSPEYYNAIDNPSNWFFSAPVLFYVTGGGHLTWMATPKLDVEAQISVRHNSSARFAYPNGGLNYWGGGLGARYHMKERSAPEGNALRPGRISDELFRKGWSLEIYAGGGVHACAAEWLAFTKTESKETQAATRLKRWPMASLSADLIYRVGGRFALGVTADGFWCSNTDRLRWADSVIYSEEENAKSKGYSPLSGGIGLVQEVFYKNAALYLQEGVYLYRHMGIHAEHGWLYERAGIRYYPKALSPFFVSACIKAHRFKADYMDFSIGIRL